MLGLHLLFDMRQSVASYTAGSLSDRVQMGLNTDLTHAIGCLSPFTVLLIFVPIGTFAIIGAVEAIGTIVMPPVDAASS